MPRISELPYKYAPSPSAFVAGVDVNENGEKINVQIPFSAFGAYKSYSYNAERVGRNMLELITDLKSKGYNADVSHQPMVLTLSGALGNRIFVGYIYSFAGDTACKFELFDYANRTLYSELDGVGSTTLISNALNNANTEKYGASGDINYVTLSGVDETTTFADIATAIEDEGGSVLGINFVGLAGSLNGNYLMDCYMYNNGAIGANLLDLSNLTQYHTSTTGLTSTLSALMIDRTYGSVTEVGGGLPYEEVYWGNPMTDMLDIITPYVDSNVSKKTIIQVYGYNSALLLVSGSMWLEEGKEVWLLNATNLYNGKMLSTGAHADPTTISINDFLNSGEYEVGGGLPYENVKWNSRDDTLDTIAAVIPEGSTSKKTIIYLNGCDYALLLVNGVLNANFGWTLDITNLYNGKNFRVEGIDPTTITIYDFLNSGEYEVSSEYITEEALNAKDYATKQYVEEVILGGSW